jgi:hypothetical protein
VDDDHSKPGHAFGDTLRLTTALDVIRFKLGAFTFEAFQIGFAGADRLAGERNQPLGNLAW